MKRVGEPFVIPGPETLVLFGVQVKVLSALFGAVGLVAGHVMGPVAAEPLGWRRHAAVLVVGLLVSLSITIATGQQPLIVLGWSVGVGWSGITIYQGWGEQARAAAAGTALGELRDRLSGGKPS